MAAAGVHIQLKWISKSDADDGKKKKKKLAEVSVTFCLPHFFGEIPRWNIHHVRHTRHTPAPHGQHRHKEVCAMLGQKKTFELGQQDTLVQHIWRRRRELTREKTPPRSLYAATTMAKTRPVNTRLTIFPFSISLSPPLANSSPLTTIPLSNCPSYSHESGTKEREKRTKNKERKQGERERWTDRKEMTAQHNTAHKHTSGNLKKQKQNLMKSKYDR